MANKYKSSNKDIKTVAVENTATAKSNNTSSINNSNTSVSASNKDIKTPNTEVVNKQFNLDNLMGGLNQFERIVSDYEYALKQIDTEQQLTQDLLHAIEFAENHKKWYKLSTELHYCRMRRRYYKNIVEVLEPIVNSYQKPENKKAINVFKDVVGKSRKAQVSITNKSYYPRVLKSLGVVKNGKVIKSDESGK